MKILKDSLERQKIQILYLGIALISGKIQCDTGLHIGAGNDELKIGGIDKYVIKTAENKPYIPGSSFKGKTRSLFEKWEGLPSNRSGGDKIYRYEAEDINEALTCRLSRIFGSTANVSENLNLPSRLIVRDFMPNKYSLEKKSENTIDRLSAHANPRTNERVSNNSEFNLQLEYNLEVIKDEKNIYLGDNNNKNDIEDYLRVTIEDLKNIFNMMMLLEYSYLGGNGSRGYGKVSFFDLKLEIKTVNDLLDNTVLGKTLEPLEKKSLKEIRQEIESQKDNIADKIKKYYESVCQS